MCVWGRGVCVVFVVARCAHLQSAAAARGIDRCCKRQRALPNRAKRCFVAVAVAWPNCGPNMCVCVLRHSLSLASCMLQAARLWHVPFVAHIQIKLAFSEGHAESIEMCVLRLPLPLLLPLSIKLCMPTPRHPSHPPPVTCHIKPR